MAKSVYRGYTQAQHEANKRYAKDNYKQYMFSLRKNDDAEIINAIAYAKEHGQNKTEWLRELYEGKSKDTYTRQQIIDTFKEFRGVLTEEIIKRMLNYIK